MDHQSANDVLGLKALSENLKIAQAQTLPELLAIRVRTTPLGEAYREFDEASNNWKSLSWADTAERVARWSRALCASNLPQGARVAILLPNGFDAMSIDQACLRCGYVPVPLHAIDNAGSIAYILADSGASLLVVAEARAWDRICATGQYLPALQIVIHAKQTKQDEASNRRPAEIAEGSQDAVKALYAKPMIVLSAWLQAGDKSVTELPAAPLKTDLAGIVYTSGTTGKPKGVMLTHDNVVSDVHAVMQRVIALQEDVFLSFLPLSHTFERTTGYYLAVATGSCVAYARSVALLSQDLKSIRPTVLISVPRIYERVFAKVQETLALSPNKHKLFDAAVNKGWLSFCAKQGIPISKPQTAEQSNGGWADLVPAWLLRKLVAQPLLAQFGGRLRIAVSGGAPLSPTIARAFLGLGLPMVQGYGMTETAPVVSANGLDDNWPDTVGKSLPGINVRIGDDQELQISGPIVMRGYWNRPADTAKTFTADGWLKTGDQAALENGRIRIKGRIKEIIVTSTGEKVPPNDVEQAIMVDPLFEQVFVVGENQPFIACVAVVNAVEWEVMAKSLGLNPDEKSSLEHSASKREALARIEKQTRSFAKYAVPRAICLVKDSWNIDNGLMTPTLKLKRKNLMAFYEKDIALMYGVQPDSWKTKD
ncbi:long-chain fatty acid--CoA ligase [Comamonas sp. Y33R10-2]|uniref:AMP-dependent synthetase/ligase n=1 Tax=Comamonas sp. Y33R10-2 TaxID=2853257 RepID=UPI001C5C9ED5|nr:long-chain fatty acid--CoA ligase [Comamonas sp. Y33R10-2]QXZ10986.1 long-chain fatty acid--CoA ligase [Comamonas sp. Y33R10-2]